MMDFVAGDTEEPFKEKETVPFRAVFVTPSFLRVFSKSALNCPKTESVLRFRVTYVFRFCLLGELEIKANIT